MTPPTKLELRRYNLQDEFWLNQHGDPTRPRFAARNIRKHLKLR